MFFVEAPTRPAPRARMGHDRGVIAQTLLVWLVAYLGLLAAVGFVLYVFRGFSDRPWSNRALLRGASAVAFVLATLMWIVVTVR